MTIVKVQRPIVSSGPHMMWLMYDQLKSRVEHCPESEVPADIRRYMDKSRGSPAYLKTFWDNVNWLPEQQVWDFSHAKPTHNRRW